MEQLEPTEFIQPKKNIFQQKWLTWIFLFIFPILGIVLLWVNRFHHIAVRIILTFVFALYMIIGGIVLIVLNYDSTPTQNTDAKTSVPSTATNNKDTVDPILKQSQDLNQKATNYGQETQEYLQDKYYNANWAKYYSGLQVSIMRTLGHETISIKVITTLTEKNGYENEIADAILGYKDISSTKFDTYKVKVHDKNGNLLTERQASK